MNAWFAEIATGIGASFAATLLIKATLTLAVALALTRLARRSRAAARHLLLLSAFVVLLVLPAASFMLPSRSVRLPATSAASSAPVTAIVPVMTSPSPIRLDAQVSVATFRRDSDMTAAALLWAIWGAGALVCLLPVLAGTWHLRELRRSGSSCALGDSLLRRLSAEAGLHRSIAVRVHESIPGPMTYGTLRPVILLP